MGALIEIIVTKGSIVDLIIFMMGMGGVGYIIILKRILAEHKEELKLLRGRYHLLNDMTGKMAIFLEPVIKRKLIRQAADGEWSPSNPLNGD